MAGRARAVTWLAALALGKRAVSALWTWLAHRSFWQLVSLALACVIVVMHFTLADARHDRDAYRAQRDGYRAQLDAISSKRNEQRVQTEKRIVSAQRTIHDAEDRARVVETAPPAPDCKTNSAVMGADL
jgi:hypothetical protein